ncbi:divalent metal cation transporter [Streptomyces sp. ALI-76-A]|uniref:divalent metal cation transporter n=1 Tax=Streptomyces sp. ALI-76-A TaxID=3025736 RepID=UPI00256F52F7|nr:divalent metal cation transporter [Streptomyces sp. ALI-76-A]MDL5199324.1 divalent metal cation transporter [Streptomyces sp. ALI-76-A]
MFLQYLSAKTGLATGRDLPTLCRDSFRRPVVVGLWAQAEVGGHGHRPGGVRGRRDRPLPALRRAHAARRADHGGGACFRTFASVSQL